MLFPSVLSAHRAGMPASIGTAAVLREKSQQLFGSAFAAPLLARQKRRRWRHLPLPLFAFGPAAVVALPGGTVLLDWLAAIGTTVHPDADSSIPESKSAHSRILPMGMLGHGTPPLSDRHATLACRAKATSTNRQSKKRTVVGVMLVTGPLVMLGPRGLQTNDAPRVARFIRRGVQDRNSMARCPQKLICHHKKGGEAGSAPSLSSRILEVTLAHPY
jgi:hypothetical protein